MSVLDRVDLVVVGGGLAGSEAAWQAAERGIRVALFEMRPVLSTGAHVTDALAELVCSNSLGSDHPERAQGLLKNELRQLGSLLIRCADQNKVPAGGALAVDRVAFSKDVTRAIETHPNIQLMREEIVAIPSMPVIVATGPLTSDKLSRALETLAGEEQLYFYDAIAPIVYAESVDMNKAYRASRYGKGELKAGDYINCPMNRDEYDTLVKEIVAAECIELKDFESDLSDESQARKHRFFEGCMPIELLASRSKDALAFGPLRPVGLYDVRNGKAPYAVVQLRQDNLAGTLYNIVGFQTNLTYTEQKRVFQMIPGLENAEFARYGQMHRNTFINSPKVLSPTLQYRSRRDLFFAGQIIGVEGYVSNIATGLLAGVNAARLLRGKEPLIFPTGTLIGALCHYVTHADSNNFQPMKAIFGLLPPLDETNGFIRGKQERSKCYANQAQFEMAKFLMAIDEI